MAQKPCDCLPSYCMSSKPAKTMQELLRMTEPRGHKGAAAMAQFLPCMLVKPWRTKSAADAHLLFFTHIWGAKISLDFAAKK